MIPLALILLCLGTSQGQQLPQGTPPQEKMVDDLTGGLTTRFSGQRLKDNQAKILINFFTDKDTGLVKRTGYIQYGNTNVCATAIRGGWSLKAPSGTEYSIVLCAGQLYITSGDGTWATHGSTVSTTQNMSVANGLGKLWFTNGVDNPFSTDGVTISSYPTAPFAKLAGSFKSRVVFANYPAQQSTVFLSGQNNGSDFTLPAVTVDTSPVQFFLNGPNDGRTTTCLYDGFRDMLILWNEDETFALYGNGVNTFVSRIMNHQIGCIDQGTVQEYQGKVRWLSKRGIEEFDGTNIQCISEDILDLTSTLVNTQNTIVTLSKSGQSTFGIGNVTAAGAGAPMSTNQFPGLVVPTSWTVTGSVLNIASMTTVNVATWTGSITFIQGATAAFINAGAESNNYTNYNSTSFVPYACSSYFGSNCWIDTLCNDPGGISASNFTFLFQVLDINNNVLISSQTGVINTSNQLNPQTYLINTTGVKQQMIRLKVTTSGCIVKDAVTLSTPFIVGTSISMKYGTVHTFTFYDPTFDIDENQLVTTGTYTTQVYDTGFSTPTWGLFTATSVSSPTNTGITFQTQVATSASGVFDPQKDTLINGDIHSAFKRYIIGVASFTVNSTTNTPPSFGTMNLVASTTGQYISPCFNLGVFNAWDLFQASIVGSTGTITFELSTGTTCGAVQVGTVTWSAQVNNAAPTIATAPFMGVRATFSSFSTATANNPGLQVLSISYAPAAGRPPSASSIWGNRYWLAFTTITTNGTFNDSVLVLGINEKWSLFKGINASSLWLYKRKLFSGSSTDGRVFIQDSGISDNGAPISVEYQSPDFDLGSLSLKHFYDLRVEVAPSPDSQPTTNMVVTYLVNQSTTPYSLGTVPITNSARLVPQKQYFNMNNPQLGTYVSLDFSDTSFAPITLYRFLLRYNPLELR